MNTSHLVLLITGTLLGGAALVAQDTATPKREAQVEHRAEAQQKRIASGLATGKLTARETAMLEMREAKIDKDIRQAEADGKITRKEQARINTEQNQASGQIHKKKHNAQTR